MSYLVRRRRPSPILIVPRQAASPSATQSPDTPGSSPSPTGVPESPDSPSPTSTSFPTAITTRIAAVTGSLISPSFSTIPPSGLTITSSGVATAVPITQAPSSTSSRTSFTSITSAPRSSTSSQKAISLPTSTSTSIPAQSDRDPSADGAGISKSPTREHHGGGGVFKSTGAEAALITMSVLGLVAALIGGILYIKRRRRQQAQLDSQRKSIETNDPGFYRPEPTMNAHITRSTASSGLFAGDDYQRPETVSTGNGGSRIQPPEPTPNPFADAPRNKAYDQLRGRPRSTTLTDRGSWVANPFRDPESERFDPFGELQAKARNERRRYVEELRREEEREEVERRRMEESRVREWNEKERMGLGVPPRKGSGTSGLTVDGVGVLDRTERGYRR
ncbi:hypothetical protein P154DRAFT_271483 [Amniculicola lignicola CBS 123094]|uniref:Gram-positive cocci surface proteins LPxTG domain-containing protein n=1 Tax=Amniculicola lignicola CBS 123094 TaxID=1392246 RepID=A0A6A5WC94_9PLEO|nr:hypothetical protein P154DRAFT_271483 [Amniculicola lignicola CBS 123094]